MLEAQRHAKEVRARLRNPLPVKVDLGIDLKRPKKPKVVIPIMQTGKPLAVSVTTMPAPVIGPYKIIYFPLEERRYVSIPDIQRAVCQHFGVKLGNMLSMRRPQSICWPRQVACYLCKILTLRSYPHIGRHFGGRDHTTILHSVHKVERVMGESENIKAEVEALKKKIMGEDNGIALA